MMIYKVISAVLLCAATFTISAESKEVPVEKVLPKVTLSVGGMSCKVCVGKVTKSLQALEGVKSVIVDLTAKTAVIEIADKAKFDKAKAIAAVQAKGFKAAVKK